MAWLSMGGKPLISTNVDHGLWHYKATMSWYRLHYTEYRLIISWNSKTCYYMKHTNDSAEVTSVDSRSDIQLNKGTSYLTPLNTLSIYVITSMAWCKTAVTPVC